jgi:hypothetical protein
MSTPKWIQISPDCNPVLRDLVESAFAGEIAYACSSCGVVQVDRPGNVCADCQKPEAA